MGSDHVMRAPRHTIHAAVAISAGEGGLLAAATRADEKPLPAGSGMAERRSLWRLEPGAGGGRALELLGAEGAFEVATARLLISRQLVERDVLTSRARLELVGRLDTAGLVDAIRVEDLPREAIAALRTVPELLAPTDLPTDAPALLVECTRRLVATCPAAWLPPRSPDRRSCSARPGSTGACGPSTVGGPELVGVEGRVPRCPSIRARRCASCACSW